MKRVNREGPSESMCYDIFLRFEARSLLEVHEESMGFYRCLISGTRILRKRAKEPDRELIHNARTSPTEDEKNKSDRWAFHTRPAPPLPTATPASSLRVSPNLGFRETDSPILLLCSSRRQRRDLRPTPAGSPLDRPRPPGSFTWNFNTGLTLQKQGRYFIKFLQNGHAISKHFRERWQMSRVATSSLVMSEFHRSLSLRSHSLSR